MWKVGDVNPVNVLGVDGYPYGFNLTTEDGQPLVSFAYVTQAKAEKPLYTFGRLSRMLLWCGLPSPGEHRQPGRTGCMKSSTTAIASCHDVIPCRLASDPERA